MGNYYGFSNYRILPTVSDVLIISQAINENVTNFTLPSSWGSYVSVKGVSRLPESKFHKGLKRKAAGRGGQVEKKVPGGRVDVKKPREVIEIDRAGTTESISKALRKLKTQTNLKKTLKVKQQHLDKAVRLAKKKNMTVTIKNLSETRRRSVRK